MKNITILIVILILSSCGTVAKINDHIRKVESISHHSEFKNEFVHFYECSFLKCLSETSSENMVYCDSVAIQELYKFELWIAKDYMSCGVPDSYTPSKFKYEILWKNLRDKDQMDRTRQLLLTNIQNKRNE